MSATAPKRAPQSLDDRENDLGRGLNRQSLRRLFGYLYPYRASAALALIAITVQTLGELALPYLLGRVIDNAIEGAARRVPGTPVDARPIFTVVGLFLLSVLVVFCARWFQGLTTTRIGYRVIFDLRFALFRHMQLLGLKTFDRLGVGRLISRIQSDVSVMQDLLTDGIIGLFADLMVLVGIIIAMVSLDRELALLTYAILPVMIAVVMIWRRYAIPVYRAMRVATSRLTGYSAESISGMRVIQSFRREEENFTRFERNNREVYANNTRGIRLNSILAPTVELLSGTATMIVLVVGGGRVLSGALTIGLLITFVGYITRFFSPVRTLSERYNSLQAATVAAERIFEVLDEPLEIADRPDARPLPRINGKVAFEHVTFGYTDRAVIRDLNLTIEPGQMVAFVGPTGAGKSSIINLVPRFYDVWDGRVAIDGHDVRDVTLASLRRQFGIVLQDTFLFSMTIGENIRYGRLDATDEEVEEAARQVGVHDFIDYPPRALRDEGRRARQWPQRRAAPVDRLRARDAGEPAHRRAGRGDKQRRYAHRADRAGRIAADAARAHRPGNRPPPLHDHRGRRDRGDRRRADRGAGATRRIAGEARCLLPPLHRRAVARARQRPERCRHARSLSPRRSSADEYGAAPHRCGMNAGL